MQHGLRLCAPRVMESVERKAGVLKTLVMLTTGSSARFTDPAILMEVLAMIKGWVVDGVGGPSAPRLPPLPRCAPSPPSYNGRTALCQK